MSKPKSKWIYMHTLDGRPAYFNGKVVVFCGTIKKFCESLRQLRKEQRLSQENVKAELGRDGKVKYGYTKFRREDLP